MPSCRKNMDVLFFFPPRCEPTKLHTHIENVHTRKCSCSLNHSQSGQLHKGKCQLYTHVHKAHTQQYRSAEHIYGDHVLCQDMIPKHYDHIWRLRLLLPYAHHMSRSYMMIPEDDDRCWHFMMLIHDHHIWSGSPHKNPYRENKLLYTPVAPSHTQESVTKPVAKPLHWHIPRSTAISHTAAI